MTNHFGVKRTVITTALCLFAGTAVAAILKTPLARQRTSVAAAAKSAPKKCSVKTSLGAIDASVPHYDPRSEHYDLLKTVREVSASVAELFDREPVDAIWAPRRAALMKTLLAERMAKINVALAALEIECRTAICRVTYTSPMSLRTQILSALQSAPRIAPIFGNGEHLDEPEQGRRTKTVFLGFERDNRDESDFIRWRSKKVSRYLAEHPDGR